MLAMKAIISGILRSYKILPPPSGCQELKFTFGVAMHPKDGVHIKLVNRKSE